MFSGAQSDPLGPPLEGVQPFLVAGARVGRLWRHRAVPAGQHLEQVSGGVMVSARAIAGIPLDAWTPSGAEDPAAVVDALLRVLSVLVDAHADGVVHGHLRSDWIWLSGDVGIQVVGFGLASAVEPAPVDDLQSLSALAWSLLGPALPAPAARARAIDMGVAEGLVRWIERLGALEGGFKSAVEARTALLAVAETVAPAGLPVPVVEAVVPSHALIGREKELGDLDALAAASSVVTVVGPGGIGKTTLVRVWLARRGQGLLVALADAKSEDDVRALVASVLGIEVAADRWTDARIAERLRGAGFVIVLDNVEQVAGPVAKLITLWLGLAPSARFVLTSRVSTGRLDEARLELGPMSPGHAVDLFLVRARARTPGWGEGPGDAETVSQLAQAVDGVPLAIEMLASRSVLLSPSEMWARLATNTAPQAMGVGAALARVFETSWPLLESELRDVALRLQVFRGGFTVDLAERFLGSAVAARHVLDVLDGLRSSSWLRELPGDAASPRRFGMYVVVQAFLESLQAPTEDDLIAHARAVLEDSETRLEHQFGPDGDTQIAGLLAGVENLLAVVARFESSRPELAARAVACLGPVLHRRLGVAERLAMLRRALGSVAPDGDVGWRLLESLARQETVAGHQADAMAVYDTMERVATAASWSEERQRLSLARIHLARAHLWSAYFGDETKAVGARVKAARGLGIAASAVDRCALVLQLSSGVRWGDEDNEAFRGGVSRAIEECRAVGYSAGEGRLLVRLSRASVHGDLERAESAAHRAVQLLAHGQDPWHAADALEALAWVQFHRNELVSAEQSATAALDRLRAHGPTFAQPTIVMGLVALQRGQWAEARRLGRLSLEAATRTTHVEDTWLSALQLLLVALLERNAGARDEAWAALLALPTTPKLAAGQVQAAVDALTRALPLAGDAQARAVFEAVSSGWPRDHLALGSFGLAMERWATGVLGEQTAVAVTLRLGPEATWFELSGAKRVDLGKRGSARRVLQALAAWRDSHPGVGLHRERLIEAGWPGERIYLDSAVNRLHVLLAWLRSQGLREVLERNDEGQFLSTTVRIERAPAP